VDSEGVSPPARLAQPLALRCLKMSAREQLRVHRISVSRSGVSAHGVSEKLRSMDQCVTGVRKWDGGGRTYVEHGT